MTLIVAIAVLLLIIGIIGAIVKRLFRVAAMFAVFILLLVGATIFLIATMN